MKKIFLLLTVAFTAFYFTSFAQVKNGKVSGTVIDGSTKIIESATISLLRAKDSSVAKLGIADKTGKFVFEGIAEGKYMVSITAVGHQKGFSETFEISQSNSDITLKTIELLPVAKSVGGVTVTSKKPMIEQKAGKTLINVDASPTNSGLNALEILEKSPGVSVDNDGNISLKGKQGVMILIDGKPTYMSGADLAAFLKNLQSSSLDQIEIMTNPPAKYDAAGNSGIINIKTKKGIVKGMNGTANLGYTQGVYGRVNAGVNLNYRNDKLNVFGGYNAGTWEGFNRLSIDRKLYENNTMVRTIDQLSKPHFKGVYNNMKAGIDYNFSKKDVAGIVVNGNFNTGEENPFSNTNIRDAVGNITSKLVSEGDNTRRSSNVSTNFNYKHTFDSTGREITADIDYVYYNNMSNTMLTTQSYDPDDLKTGDAVLKGTIPSIINIYSGKIDYVHPLRKGMKIEAGLKSSFVNTDNKVDYLRNTNGGNWVNDQRSNHFIYDENINAAYAIFSGSFKKVELSAGLRLENTVAKGYQVSNDSSFKRNYTNLFPNVGLSYAASEKNQFNLSYSRRVSRPDYASLNPFIFFLDSLTYGKGNPYLQPQFTNNIEFSHTFRRILTTTLNYTVTNDIITELLKQNTEKNETYQTKENFSSMKQFGIALMANIPITKWWSSNMYVNVFNNHYSGIYEFDQVDIQFTTLMANMTNSFTLGKGWTAEISGWYRTKGAEGLLVINGMGALNTALSKQLMKKKATLKLGLRDVFYTQQFSGYAKYSDVDVNIAGRRDTRQANLSFTWRFGKTNIAPERKRKSSSTDEQNRVGTGTN
ncbi:MAG TPA: TonB-dependent receptor [Chitinophagaceae bacterium]